MERVGDIVQEVEQKVHSLNLQLKRFKRHEKLSEELKDKELSLAFIHVHEFESHINPLRQRVIEFNHLKDEKASDTSTHEKELNQLKSLYGDQQRELHALHKTLNELEEVREAARNNVLVWSEQDKAAEATIQRLKREKDANEDKKVQLTSQMSEYDSEISALTPQADKQLSLYKTKKSEFENVEGQYKKAQEELETAQGNRWDAQRKMADDRSLLDRTLSFLEEKNNSLSRMENKIQEIESIQKKQGAEQKVLESKKSKLEKSTADLQTQLNLTRESLNVNREKRSALSMEIHSEKSRLESFRSQVAFYIELIEQKEGYPEGVRAVLDSQGDYPGIIGTVGEIFQIDEQFDAAFQSALGDWAQCILAEDRKSALDVLAIARSQKIGNLSILPLKELGQLQRGKSKTPKGNGIIGTGAELCGTDKKFQSLAHLLVGNLLIVEDLNDGKELQGLEMGILYTKIPDSIKKEIIDPYISIKNNEARISLRILDSKENLRRNELIKKINFDLENQLGLNREEFKLAGVLILFNNLLQSLFKSQILTLGIVMTGITMMFLILFRNITLSLIGVVPNFMAAFLILGIIGLLKIPLDMMTITIAAITIGIAVDNSIHYIYRFKEEFKKINDYNQTVQKCHETVGVAILNTSITIVFGFSILVLSNFIPTIYFGVFTGIAMLLAMISVLTLLPKLILIVKPFGNG